MSAQKDPKPETQQPLHKDPEINPPEDQDDPFDSLLTLEDTLYTTAFELGTAAGSRAGRIEGRIFGLEQGFEKFATLGELHGRSVVWGSRILNPNSTTPSTNTTSIPTSSHNIEDKSTRESEQVEQKNALPTLPQNPRLKSNILLLHSLTDPATFSTQNEPDAVADFDDRVKRGGSKAKVIERIVGENPGAKSTSADAKSPARAGKESGGKVKKGDDSMEDFAGSRLLR